MANRLPPHELRLSDQGAALLDEREGLRLKAYRDSRGVLTIGLGHTSSAGPPKVTEGMTITEAQAREIFRADNARFRDECLRLVKVPLHPYEFDALASFIYNVGSTAFAKSTALKRLNAKDYVGCAEALLFWNKPSEIKSRRKAEHDQFLNIRHVARA